jgi:N-acetylmuramoyl-L-alanine amidase
MKKTKSTPFSYTAGFLLFSLIFVIIGLSVSSLWKYIGKRAEAGLMMSAEAQEPITVVIDPGHGGRDGGAVGVSTSYEKELNLEISLILRDMLTASGINVVMTRTEDVMLSSSTGGTLKNQDLRARRDIAESVENPIFVSIHMNAFPVEKYSGLEIYYSQNNESSKDIAKLVRESVISNLGTGENRQIKPAGENIYLLDVLNCPAILVECGFLSNHGDAERLNDPSYRQQLALVIAMSLHESILEIKGLAS